jgi:hypothetical protein
MVALARSLWRRPRIAVFLGLAVACAISASAQTCPPVACANDWARAGVSEPALRRLVNHIASQCSDSARVNFSNWITDSSAGWGGLAADLQRLTTSPDVGLAAQARILLGMAQKEREHLAAARRGCMSGGPPVSSNIPPASATNRPVKQAPPKLEYGPSSTARTPPLDYGDGRGSTSSSPRTMQYATLALTPSELVAVCEKRSKLTSGLADLERQAAITRRVIDNYGFVHTAAEFRAIGDSLESGAARQSRLSDAEVLMPPSVRIPAATYLTGGDAEKLTKELKGRLLKKVQAFLKDFITGMSSRLSTRYYTIERYLAMTHHFLLPDSVRASLLEFAKDPDARARLKGYAIALQVVGRFDTAFELAKTEDEKELLWKSVMAAAGEINPVYGALAKEVDWAGHNVYDALTGRWAEAQIDRLTTMTEAELMDLKGRTNRLEDLTLRLASNRETLRDLPACDSTQLVK